LTDTVTGDKRVLPVLILLDASKAD